MYTITPVYSNCLKKQMQNRPDYVLKIFTRDESLVRTFHVDRYIDALRVVQQLQMHLKKSDKQYAA